MHPPFYRSAEWHSRWLIEARLAVRVLDRQTTIPCPMNPGLYEIPTPRVTALIDHAGDTNSAIHRVSEGPEAGTGSTHCTVQLYDHI